MFELCKPHKCLTRGVQPPPPVPMAYKAMRETSRPAEPLKYFYILSAWGAMPSPWHKRARALKMQTTEGQPMKVLTKSGRFLIVRRYRRLAVRWAVLGGWVGGWVKNSESL